MDHRDITKRRAMASVCSSEAKVINILIEATMNIQRWYTDSYLVIWLSKLQIDYHDNMNYGYVTIEE